jgi:hypothetical protein
MVKKLRHGFFEKRKNERAVCKYEFWNMVVETSNGDTSFHIQASHANARTVLYSTN